MLSGMYSVQCVVLSGMYVVLCCVLCGRQRQGSLSEKWLQMGSVTVIAGKIGVKRTEERREAQE